MMDWLVVMMAVVVMMMVAIMLINFTSDGCSDDLMSLFMFVDSKVLVVENSMGVLNGLLGSDGVGFLLDVNNVFWGLNNKWNFLSYCVLFELVGGDFTYVVDFVWNLDDGSVMLPEFNNVWLINGNSEWNLVPLSHLEFVLDVEWLLLVLSDWNLLSNNVWDLLDDGVVNSLGGLVWHLDVLLIRDLIVYSVWDLLSSHIWDLVGNSVWYLLGVDVWNLNLNFEWNLSFDCVWDLFLDLVCLKSLNGIFLGNILGMGNLVWNFLGVDNSDLLWDMVLFSHIVSNSVSFFVIRRVGSSWVVVIPSNLSPGISVIE